MISFGLGLRLARAAEGEIVHSHQHLEDLKVAFRFVRRGQEGPQYAGFGQDQGLSALPVGAERGQGLAVYRHLLLVRLGRQLLHRKEALDERGGVLEREGHDRGPSGSGGFSHVRDPSNRHHLHD